MVNFKPNLKDQLFVKCYTNLSINFNFYTYLKFMYFNG